MQKKTIKILILFLLMLVFQASLAQNIKKGFKYLKYNETEKSQAIFQSVLKLDSLNAAANYGISLILKEKQGKESYRKALFHARLASEYFPALSPREVRRLKRFFSYQDIKENLTNLNNRYNELYAVADSVATEPQDSTSENTQWYNPIRGKNTLMTASDSTNWEQWKKEMYALADSFPAHFYISGNPALQQVALTFDDVPDKKFTPQLLDTLKKYNTTAAFFALGNNIEKYPEITQRIVSEGHLLLNHSYSHQRFTTIAAAEIEQETAKAQQIIQQYTGSSHPHYIRPPYGACNQGVVQQLIDKHYTLVLWSLDTFDWAESPQHVLQNVENHATGGDIILMHNRQTSVTALAEIILFLQNAGFEIVRLDQLLQQSENH